MPPSFLRPMLFGRALQGSAFFRNPVCARLLPSASLLSFGLWRITTCSALISGFLCLLLHLYCSQRSTASHFVTHTRHKVLERVRCVRLSCLGPRRRAGCRPRGPRSRPAASARPARRPCRDPRATSTASPAVREHKVATSGRRGPPHTGHATRRDDESRTRTRMT